MAASPRRTQIGDIVVVPVHDGSVEKVAVDYWNFAADVTDFDRRTQRPRRQWAGFSAADWQRHPESVDEDGVLLVELGGYLIDSGGYLTLVDLGVGPQTEGLFRGGAFLDSLQALGVEPSQIRDILLTHLHGDHIGWGWQNERLTFPNATIHCHAKDWEFFVGGNRKEAKIARRFEPNVRLWDRDFTLAPGVDLVAAPGHTPGSSMVFISSGNERAVLLGDAVHCPAELLEAEWAGLGDVDPDLASRTRIALARELEDGRTRIGAAHFPGLQFGRLVKGSGRALWQVA
jgi:glyoxylase-like metal-dependent hydrolase (beta-lactamase superfamily II)